MEPDDPRNPDGIVWEELIGKYVLVGITRKDMRDADLGQEQIHGRVVASDPNGGLSLRLEGTRTGDIYSLPPDLRSFKPAPPGDYRLRSTGEVVQNPTLSQRGSSFSLTASLRPTIGRTQSMREPRCRTGHAVAGTAYVVDCAYLRCSRVHSERRALQGSRAGEQGCVRASYGDQPAGPRGTALSVGVLVHVSAWASVR